MGSCVYRFLTTYIIPPFPTASPLGLTGSPLVSQVFFFSLQMPLWVSEDCMSSGCVSWPILSTQCWWASVLNPHLEHTEACSPYRCACLWGCGYVCGCPFQKDVFNWSNPFFPSNGHWLDMTTQTTHSLIIPASPDLVRPGQSWSVLTSRVCTSSTWHAFFNIYYNGRLFF